MNEYDRRPSAESPTAALLRMIEGFWISRALFVAVTLGIADLLKGGPKTSKELAAATGTHASSLYRVLRALAGAGIFAEDEGGRFGATPLSATLQTGAPRSVRAFVLEELDEEHYRAWGDMLYTVKTGETPFDHVFGMNLWQYRARHPKDAKTFDEAMTDHTALVQDEILASYDFSQFKTVVDIGGGEGGLLAAILQAHPNVKGVLFDVPSVAARAELRIEAKRLSNRCEIISGDFFQSVPAGGDAYILKAVIHDWDDGRAKAILKNCRGAMTKDSRLLLIEAAIPPGNGHFFYKLMDLNMMVMTGGRERTEAEYRELLAAAGFRLTRIVPTEHEVGMIEAVCA